MKRRYMEASFLVDPAHITHTLDQCAGLRISNNFCSHKLYVTVDRNNKSDFVHKHDISCQSDVLVAV